MAVMHCGNSRLNARMYAAWAIIVTNWMSCEFVTNIFIATGTVALKVRRK